MTTKPNQSPDPSVVAAGCHLAPGIAFGVPCPPAMKLHATLLLLGPWTAVAGAFTDLDFEAVQHVALTRAVAGGEVAPASLAFPGWTVLVGGVPQPAVLYNDFTTGSGSVNLFSTFPPDAGYFQPLAGNYTADLACGTGPLGKPAALEQTGTIPAGSQTMTFIGSVGQSLSVSLNGSLAPIVDLGHTSTGQFTDYASYGVNVSAWAGQTVQLEFASGNPPAIGGRLDNISFSPVALAPEPSTYALFGFGAAAVLWFRRRQT